jgi:diguanylate cyclase (GGDEF)-like protein
MTGAALGASSRRGAVETGAGSDPATGFWSRERLLNDLRAALRGSQQHGMPMSLMLIEVTGLAELRKASGPVAADGILARLAESVVAGSRVGDVPYRFGFDEVAVLLPGTDLESAQVVAERLVAGVPVDGPASALRTAVVPVEGVAEDIVLAAVRSLAAAVRGATT